jgi:flavin-dependent dehydrogenase
LKRSTYDVAVIGGGPGGSVTALLLARAGISVLLLEATDYRAPRTGETFSPSVNQQLLQLGVLRNVNDKMANRTEGVVSVWTSPNPQVSDFLRGINGNGWHVDRAAFDQMLARAARRSGVTVRSGSRMTGAPRRSHKRWLFEFTSNRRSIACECRFLVDATGRSGSSPVARLSPRVALDRLIAIIWTGKTVKAGNYLTVESIPDGWFYSAGLPGQRTTVVYMTDSDLYREGCKLHPDFWRRRLSQTNYAQERLSSKAASLNLRIVSAATVVRAESAGEHWCAVGDASLSHDPLSGRGVYDALQSASHAASAIEEYLHRGKPLIGYTSWTAGRLHDYLISRRLNYATERRWQSSPFWQRRQQ